MNHSNRPYDLVDAGPMSQLGQYFFQPNPDFRVDGKLFVAERLGMFGAELSLNRMPPGASMPIFHSHQRNEEVYVFVGGQGEMQVADERIAVQEGTVVRISPEARRIFRNTGPNDLYFVCIQYRQGPGIEREGGDAVVYDEPAPW